MADTTDTTTGGGKFRSLYVLGYPIVIAAVVMMLLTKDLFWVLIALLLVCVGMILAALWHRQRLSKSNPKLGNAILIAVLLVSLVIVLLVLVPVLS